MEFRKPSEYDALKDLGLSPAQIKEAIENGKKEKERADKLATEVSTTKSTLQAMENSFTETKQRLDNLEANPGRRSENNEDPKPKTSFIDDEDKAFNERFIEKVGPVAATALKAAANSAKMSAKMSLQGQFVKTSGGRISLARLWDKWSSEIDKDAKDVPFASLGDMQTWINIFNYVKGKHFDEMMAEPQTFIESAETSVDRVVGSSDHREDDKLNTEESATIKKMSKYAKHITPESYLETKKKMTYVGE